MTSKNGQSLESVIVQSARTVSSGWKKQRKKEERAPRLRSSRSTYYYSTRTTQKSVVESHLSDVYDVVSGGGSIIATARQLFYRMRPIVEQETKETLQYGYFSQTLLPDMAPTSWKIAYDDRGHFIVPHTEHETIGVGTMSIDSYLGSIYSHDPDRHGENILSDDGADSDDATDRLNRIKLPTNYPTKGVYHRCSAVLFIEKEGFHPVIEDSELCERYDLALLSTKGQTVTAARKLVEQLCGEDCPLLLVHDLDAYGIRITKNAVTSNRRYQFASSVNYIDLGLHYSDVKEWGLGAEPCTAPGIDDLHGWMKEGDYGFLIGGQRVELNAFTSPDFIAWLESKLDEHGISKVVPDQATLESAYKRAWVAQRVNDQLEDLISAARKKLEKETIPPDLEQQVRDLIEDNREVPWDEAVLEILTDSPPDDSAT